MERQRPRAHFPSTRLPPGGIAEQREQELRAAVSSRTPYAVR